MSFARCLFAGLLFHGFTAACLAQAKQAEPAGAANALAPPALRLPAPSELGLSTPRPVKAVSAALGMGRQRLALVVGNGKLGSQPALASAPRDVQAVAAALRAAGFVVMLREDLGAADLRASLAELRDRLQPGSVGFVYITALGAQVDGQNLWLPREAALDPTLPAAQRARRLAASGVPVSEIVNALLGTPDSPRMLVLDAAYQHPALADLPQTGFAEQRLPPGMVALFSSALGVAQARPQTADLPAAPATDDARPADLAASRFARVVVEAIAQPRATGPQALRSARKALFDGSQGQVAPWISGDNDNQEELAEITLLDSVIPRTPEDFAREALKQASGQGGRRAGEQTVAEVLQQSASTPASASPADATGDEPKSSNSGNRRAPPSSSARPPSLSPTGLVDMLGVAASAVAGVAGAAAAVATAPMATEAVLAVAAAGAVTGAAGAATGVATSAGAAAASSTASMVSRLLSQSAAAGSAAATAPAAAEATALAAAASPVAALAAAPVVPSVAPAIPTPVAAGAAPPAVAPFAGGAGSVPVAAPAVPAAVNPVPVARQAGSPAPVASRVPSAPPPLDGRTARNASGGERPAYTPRRNSFGYAEGDTFTYQVTDTWKGEVTGTYTTAIEEVLGDGQLRANGAELLMDAQGRITRQQGADGTVSTFEPSQALWWANPQRGQRRDLRFKESFQRADATKGQTEWKGSTSVGRLRQIDTPAGPFEALPIESSGWYYEALENGARNSGQWSRTVWYSPKLGHPVAIDIEDADRVGKLLRRERVELMHAQTQRGTP